MPQKGWSGTKPTDFLEEIENATTEHVKELAGRALQGVIMRSPVDTGAFRANNRLAIGSPDATADVNDVDRSGAATLQKGLSNLSLLKTPFAVVYITNSLPYAEPLEHGHSQQAPAGIYGVTFNSIREYGAS